MSELNASRYLIAALFATGCVGGVESSGGGGGAGGVGANKDTGDALDPSTVQPGSVVISEIMYHPVGEDSAADNHEFIEIHNRGGKPVFLARWRLQGAIHYEFPAGSSIAPRQYLVVAKSRDMLLAVAAYALAPTAVIGNYGGELGNGGGHIELLDAGGTLADSVTYKDGFPWPISADALGVGAAWLPESLLPIEKHTYMGVSLERVNFDVPANEVANWVPSPVDGATPAKANVATGAPLPVVEELTAAPEAQADPLVPALVRASGKVVVSAAFSKRGKVTDVQVESFVDDPQKIGEPTTLAPMLVTGTGYSALLAAHADNSIVRYRILANRGAGTEVISPRPTDPYAWHAYFVSPVMATKAPVYQIFISSVNWGKMWTNIAGGPVKDCALNPGWVARVPATFVHEGKVYDVRVRYQGSRYNRVKGNVIAQWPYPGPAGGPSPLLSMSWSVHFPNYQRFEGIGKINLNKLKQSCPGLDGLVVARVLNSVGVPAQQFSFARLHVNGGYYNYVMRVEATDDDMAARMEGKGNPIGDMFKANGTGIDDGPIAFVSDGSPLLLNPKCPLVTLEQRYQSTYYREAPGWKGARNDELIQLINDLAAARAGGKDVLRAFLEKTFDVNVMLNEFAIRNWSGAWDDTAHNYLPYRRPDGKWIIIPQDLDQHFGGCGCADGPTQSVNTSFYEGEEGDVQLPPPVPPATIFSYFKDSFQKNYRAEFDQRLRELSKTILKPENFIKTVDDAAAGFSVMDWNQIPAKGCNVPDRIEQIRKWARDRHAILMQRLGQ